MKRIPWNSIRQMAMRFPSVVAEHAFPSTLALIAVAGVFSLVIFAYGFSVQTKHVEQGTSLYDAKEDLFLDTIGVLEEQERSLGGVGKEISRDMFNPD